MQPEEYQNLNQDAQNLNQDTPSEDPMNQLQNKRPRRKRTKAETPGETKTTHHKKRTGIGVSSVNDVPPLGMEDEAPQPKQRNAKLIAEIAGVYLALGMAITTIDKYDGMIVMYGAGERATELVRVAEKHPPMLKVLKQFTKVSVYGAFIMGHGMMLAAIAVHHGIIPPFPIPGITFEAPPSENNHDAPTPDETNVFTLH